MDLETIGIVGLGLIGGSLALALRRAAPGLRIIGVDSDERTRQLSVAEDACHACWTLEEAPLADCQVVVLAVPAEPMLAILPQVAARMRPGSILTDVCGAKERICAAGAQQERVVFAGAHPMAGTEYRGFVAAHPALFRGCTVALCPPSGNAKQAALATRRVRELWTAAGAEKLLEVTPAAHDQAVTFASHLPYLAAAAVVEALHASPEVMLASELAAGGFRDTTRLAGDGTISGAAALNRFLPEAARQLAQTLRELADLIDQDAAGALVRLGQLAEDRRRMKLPRAAR
jgi:prephenate dehydrogenase